MLTNEAKITVPAPAKLNLFLAITGRRSDGFHDLVSVVTQVEFGDTLQIELKPEGAEGPRFALSCDDATVPLDGSNLILKAAEAFGSAAKERWSGGAKFFLTKRVPMGAGLGGGSSDAAATLRGLNALTGTPLTPEQLLEIATGLGSDCPLFLQSGPVVMRGRGEKVEALSAEATARLRGRRVVIFKPAFGISTPWAYGRMVARDRELRESPGKRRGIPAANEDPRIYLPPTEAEARLAEWLGGKAPAEALLYNNMERVAFEKFLALPVMLERLERKFGLTGRMSGSGSACFALLPEDAPVEAIMETIRADAGPTVFAIETRIT